MANEFVARNGIIAKANSSITGTLDVSGNITMGTALVATRSWVTSTALTGYATENYVTTAINNLIDAAPGTLNTLNELAAALGDDPNFATTISNTIATKLPLAGGSMTGDITWTTTGRGLVWTMNTDGAYIRFYNTGDGDTDSRLEYGTSDNGNEYHRWMVSSVEEMNLKSDGLRVANSIWSAGNLVATQSWVTSQNYLTSYTNTYVTGAAFNTSTGVLTLTRNDAGTVTVDLDGKYAEAAHTHSAADITSGTLASARLSGTYAISITGNAATATSASSATTASNVNGSSGQLLRRDNRTIAPNEIASGYLQFGFTSFNNNNTAPWADYLHLRSYTDSSGGNDNLLVISKSTKSMRLYQQSWNSGIAYSSYVDFWTTGNFTGTDVTNWNTAYSWGNHASAGYLTSYTETDPIYTASSWYTTTNNSSNWNTAYSWGNHAGLYDNYGSWNLKTNGVQRTTVQSGGTLDIVAGTNVSVSYGAGGVVTINSTDTNTNNYLTGLSFATGTGVLTATRSGLSDLTVSLDGRYLTSYAETDTLATVTTRGNVTTNSITTSTHNIYANTNATFYNSGGNATFHQFESYWNTSSAGSIATLRFDVGTWRLWSAGIGDSVVTVKSNGYVNIGANTPLAKLSVGAGTTNTGSDIVMFSSNSTGLANVLSLVNETGGSNGRGVRLSFHNQNNWSATGAIDTIQTNGTESALVFSTYNSGLSEKMRITHDGNVAINSTTTSGYKLYVNGSTWINGGTNFQDGVSIFRTQSGAAEVMRIASNGNVGIGTTNPGAKLDVVGQVSIDSDLFVGADGGANYTASRIRLYSHNNYRGAGVHMTGVDSNWFIGTPYTDFSGTFIIARKGVATSEEDTAQASNALFTVKSTGNVGIGTTSPTTTLDVRTDSGVFIKGATGAIDGRIALVPASGGRQYGLRNYGSSFGIKDESADVIRLYFHYDGNTGIGTTSPGDKLEVAGNVYANAFNSIGTLSRYNGTGGVAIAGLAGTPYAYIKAYSNSGGAGKAIAIQPDGGNVGIGTTSPTTKLYIQETATTPTLLTLHNYQSDITPGNGNFIEFLMTDDNATATPQAKIGMVVGSEDGQDSGIATEGDGNFVIMTMDATDSVGGGTLAERVRVTHTGKVGIGTSSPTDKLHVAGNIRTSGSIYLSNTNIVGVNQLEIDDPGEGIIWRNGASGDITLAVKDDATDNILELTGTNASLSVNGAKVATESYVSTAISNLVDSAPGTLDTLNELAAALGDDPNFSTTITTALGNRLRVDTAAQGLNATQQSNGRTNLGLGTAATSSTSDFAAASHTHTFASLTSKPTTLAGYGITDAASSTHNHDTVYVKLDGSSIISNTVKISSNEMGGTYRSWMTQGVLVGGGGSDGAYFGMKVNAVNDAQTVIAWGDDNGDNLHFVNTISGGAVDGVTYMSFFGSQNTIAVYKQLDVQSTVYATSYYEGGTALSAKYLGISATAADSNKLGGIAAASYAQLASPAFTGTPTAPTAATATNNTQIATTAFVKAQGYSTTTGTVTSVGLTVPTGLAVSGTPVTTSGTLAITYASGYSIPTNTTQSNWNTAYSWGNHAGLYLPIGAKAADSELLDGQDSTGFFRLISGVAGTSLDTVTANGFFAASYTGYSSQVWNTNTGGSTGTVQMEFEYNTPVRGFKIRNRTDNNNWSATGWVVMSQTNQGHIGGTIWHSSNDGASSGLDADLLDGQQGSYYLDWTNVTNKPDPVVTLSGAVTGSATMTDLGSITIATTHTADPVLTLAGDATGSATFTNLGNATLTVTVVDDSHNHIISNVDGLQTALDGKLSLSGGTITGVIDAGSSSTAAYRFDGRSFSWNSAMQSPTTNVPHIMQQTYTGWDPVIGIKTTSGFWQHGAYSSDTLYWGYMAGAFGSHSTNSFDYAVSLSPTVMNVGSSGTMSLQVNSNTVWHAGNDGSGSSLDADLLDGQHGSYYLDSTNLTGTIPSARLSGTYSISVTGNANTATTLATSRTIALSGDVTGSASFNGGSNITITATVADDSHNHIISNVDGLQTALDSKPTLVGPNNPQELAFFQSPTDITSQPELMWTGTDLMIVGGLQATTKSFNIEHPTKPGKRLVYGVLEGPEHGVYTRGRTTEKTISLPEEWTGLVDEDSITVQLTAVGKPCLLYVVDIADNKVFVDADTENIEYFYYIQGTRKDIDKLEIEQ